MSYEELSINGFIQEIQDVSDGHHPRKFCFVLGAGASISSGIKSGQELVDIWDDKLRIRNKSSYLKWRSEYSGSSMKINTVFTVNITNIILKDIPKTDITFLKN